MNIDLSRAKWFKSSYSGGHGDCVEVAHLHGGTVGVRDSKDPSGPVLMFAPTEWDAFVARTRNGEFDRS